MKNAINLYSVLLVFILSIFCITTLLAQEEQIRKDISLIAERDFKVFLEKIPIGMETKYGFSNRNEFEKASIGEPLSILFPADNFYSTDPIDSSKTNYEISTIWEVPILFNGNICCLLRMKAINNNCTIIGIGGSLSALSIDKILKSIGLNKMKYISLLKFSELQCQYLVTYENSPIYANSKCYKIREQEESGELMEETLLNVFVTSKQQIKERKDFDYGK